MNTTATTDPPEVQAEHLLAEMLRDGAILDMDAYARGADLGLSIAQVHAAASRLRLSSITNAKYRTSWYRAGGPSDPAIVALTATCKTCGKLLDGPRSDISLVKRVSRWLQGSTTTHGGTR